MILQCKIAMDQYHLRMVALFEVGDSRYEYYINCGGITVMKATESGESQWFEVMTPRMELYPIKDFNEVDRVRSENDTCAGSVKSMSEVFGQLLAPEMLQLINHYIILARGCIQLSETRSNHCYSEN